MNIIKTHIAGTTFNNRQGFICYLNAHATDAYVTVRREPNNPFDPNAVRVLGHVRGGKHVDLGYIPRNLAEELAPIMDKGEKAFVQDFSVVRARHAKNYGVVITIKY